MKSKIDRRMSSASEWIGSNREIGKLGNRETLVRLRPLPVQSPVAASASEWLPIGCPLAGARSYFPSKVSSHLALTPYYGWGALNPAEV
jgi:hypothetical protein